MDWRALVAQVMVVLAIFAILCRVSRRKLYLNFSPRQKRTRRSIPAATTEGLTKTDGPGPRCSRGAARSSRYHRPDESKRPRPGVVFFVVGVVVVWVSSQSRLSIQLMAWFALLGEFLFGSRPVGRPRQKEPKSLAPTSGLGVPGSLRSTPLIPSQLRGSPRKGHPRPFTGGRLVFSRHPCRSPSAQRFHSAS